MHTLSVQEVHSFTYAYITRIAKNGPSLQEKARFYAIIPELVDLWTMINLGVTPG